MAIHIRRREFIFILGGAAAWPPTARAQQPERMRRIGVLMPLAADDPEAQARIEAFRQGLQQLGWTDGRNVRIDTRSTANADDIRKYAAELAALAPDVIPTRLICAHGRPRERLRAVIAGLDPRVKPAGDKQWVCNG